MAKEFSYTMSHMILNSAETPLRNRESAVLLLLNTLRMIEASSYITSSLTEKVIIYTDKMNRIFYVLNDKIFSMQFPFHIEKREGKNIYSCSYAVIGQSELSFLIGVFNILATKKPSSFEEIYENFLSMTDNGVSLAEETAWNLTHYLLSYDLGYLRYDYDEKNNKQHNANLHPLNHLDVFLDSGATFKIGLKKRISYSEFCNILDTTTDCLYLQ